MLKHFPGIVAAAAILAASPAAGRPVTVNSLHVNDPYAAELPNGSYQQTCTQISVSGSTLYARCPNSQGNLKDTQLNNYASAGGQDIANCEGVLTIGRCPSAFD